ncbi:MAG: MobF family relaxase [Acidimicrobiales bacterium]
MRRHPATVLRVAKVRAGGERYYLDAAGGPGRRGIEAPGQWLGSGAAVLELHGVVEGDDLATVLAGVDPLTGESRSASQARVTVAGFDLTFGAPKSVSVLHALGDDDVAGAVRTGHERAVAAAMDYVERRALAVRRVGEEGLRLPAPAEGVAAAAFVHRTSRALDPHLHSHVVVANVGRGPERTWSALDGRGVYAHASAAGALYQAQLRHELTTTLGVAWEPLRGGRADIAGIGTDVRRAFSRRSEEIAAHLVERGLSAGEGPRSRSTRARAVAGVATRAERDLDRGADDLGVGWRERARALGLGPARLEALLGRVPERAVGGHEAPSVDEVLEAVVRTRPDGFTRRHVVHAAAALTRTGAPVGAVEHTAGQVVERSRLVDDRSLDGIGVAESRRVLAEHVRHRELAALLERRGMYREQDRGLGRERGAELGFG